MRKFQSLLRSSLYSQKMEIPAFRPGRAGLIGPSPRAAAGASGDTWAPRDPLVDSTYRALRQLPTGTAEERARLGQAFQQAQSVSAAFLAASHAGISWATYTAALQSGLGHLADQPRSEAYARASLQLMATAPDCAGAVGRQAAVRFDQAGSLGQKLAGALTAAGREGIGWDNFRQLSLQLFTQLETSAEASPAEQDLSTVARNCVEACPDPEDGGKVAWSFLAELGSGRSDAPAQRLARIMLDAAERGMSWSNYAGVVRVGLDVLEADGAEKTLLQVARQTLDGCRLDSTRGRLGQGLMQQLTRPLEVGPEVAVGRLFSAAAEQGLEWDELDRSARIALESLGKESLPPQRALFVQVARAAQNGGVDVVEQGKLARAYLGSLAEDPDLGPGLYRAAQESAAGRLSYEGFETSLDLAVRALGSSSLVSEADRAALAGPYEGEALERCRQRAQAMKNLGPLTGLQDELARMGARPAAEGLGLTAENLTVGGVRLKVRRAANPPPD